MEYLSKRRTEWLDFRRRTTMRHIRRLLFKDLHNGVFLWCKTPLRGSVSVALNRCSAAMTTGKLTYELYPTPIGAPSMPLKRLAQKISRPLSLTSFEFVEAEHYA